MSNLFALFSVGLKGNLKSGNSSDQTIMEERTHTTVSLFQKLKADLETDQLINRNIDTYKIGDFVEIQGNLKTNPLIEMLSALKELMALANLFSDKPKNNQSKKDKLMSDAKFNAQIEGLINGLQAGGKKDIICEASGLKVVLPTDENYFLNNNMSEIMLIVLLWYAIVTTVFAAIRSGIFLGDFTAFFEVLWNGIRQSCKWIVGVAKALAQVGDKIPNEMIAIIVHWLLFIMVIAGVAGVIGVLIVIVEKKVTKAYRENCWDVISVGMAVIGLAVAVYFGDWIKALVKLNLVALLLLVQAVYVGIRVYVKGCKRARGYY